MLGAEVRSGLEFLVKKLHQDPNPNKDTWMMSEAEIVDRFWTEFADFCNMRGVFGAAERWDGGTDATLGLARPTCGTRSIP